MRDLGLLILRLSVGGFLAAHGSQKLFGTFEGGGPEGTGKFMEQLGFRPGEQWAITAGLGEFAGGMLTCLGFLSPIGPLAGIGPMLVAWFRAHGDKPIFAQQGGGELPVTNIAIASALALTGPGRLSVDRLFGIRLPAVFTVLAAAGVAAGVMSALSQPRPSQQAQPAPEQATEPEPAETL
jgi:putative oxidoreductase